MNREAIYGALFAKVSAAAEFRTKSRRFRTWDLVDANQQPAIFQVQDRETTKRERGRPNVNTLRVDLYVYAQAPDPDAPPSSTLNPLIDAVTAALAPEPATARQTLGGLVQDCWIEGEIEIFEGTLGQQAIAIVPVQILAPGN